MTWFYGRLLLSTKILRKILEEGKEVGKEHLNTILEGVMGEYDLLRETFDREKTGHIIVDKKSWRICLLNRSLSKMIPLHQISFKEGKSLLDVVKDPDIKKYFLKISTGEESLESRDFSFGEGEIKTIRVSFTPFMLSDSEYLDICFEDITEMLKKEMKLRNTEALASMTTMAAGVAHDIKNPLAAMRIYISLLRKAVSSGKGMDKAEEFLDVLDQETERLNEIAVDFLFAVKPIDINLKLDRINDILNELADFIAVEALQKNITVELHLEPFLPSIMLDSKLLRRAFLNIINNSFYAMKTGGVLILESKPDGDFVRVTISDNGCGMTEEQQKKIFEPYYTTKSEGGTGLGLTAVLKIMNAHKADIEFDSKVGMGTSFSFKFPIPPSERKAIESKEE